MANLERVTALLALSLPVFWIVAPEVKLRPNATVTSAREARLEVGRGECAAFQLALRAGDAPLSRVAASAGPFVGLGPAAAKGGLGAALRLSREVEVQLGQPSGPEGLAGAWPDPLIPAVDESVGERRNAFPVALAAGGLLPIWAEVCVPRAAPPGDYRSTLHLRSSGGELAAVPIHLWVRRFALPATSTLKTSFGLSLPSLLHLHAAKTAPEQAALLRRYAVAGLLHRISLHGMSMEPPPVVRRAAGFTIDFRAYDAELGPLLDGTALPSGARFTTTDLRTPRDLRDDAERVAYWRAFAGHLRARGSGAWLFDYAADEPTPAQFQALALHARLIHTADAALPVLVTVPLQQALVGAIDVWTPNINCLLVKRRPSEFCALRAPLAAYGPRLAQGDRLWWYVSCSSQGCGGKIPPEALPYFHGWPSYVIDVPGDRNRAMGPLAFRYGIEGELYYNTVEAYQTGDPWVSSYRFGGNGDGTLFYPGTPARIGGRTEIPIPSLRLKLIRAGLEDYEALALLRRLGDRGLADRLAREWLPNGADVDVSPERREALRHRIDDRLDQLWREPSAPLSRQGGAR